jgi:hypothetical protein
MGSTEFIANLFRISQTEEKLRKDEVNDAKAATAVHGCRNDEFNKGNAATLKGNIPRHFKRDHFAEEVWIRKVLGEDNI